MVEINRRALLPKGEPNGFTAIADDLEKDPLRYRAAVVVFNAKRATRDFDEPGAEVITVRVLRVARLLPQDLPFAEAALRRAAEFDAGETTLPLDLEDEIRKAFEAMADPTSTVDPDEAEPPAEGDQ